MMATTTSSSTRGKARRRRDMERSFLPGRVKETASAPAQGKIPSATERGLARMPGAEASEHNPRQAGLLADGSWRPRTTFPQPVGAGRSGLRGSEAWPITAAAPQRIRTVFPIIPSARRGGEEPVETYGTGLSWRTAPVQYFLSRLLDALGTGGLAPTGSPVFQKSLPDVVRSARGN